VLKSIMKKAYVSLWTEFICPRIAIFGGKFWTYLWTFTFNTNEYCDWLSDC
jgi:hypothetical protein